MTTAKQNSKTLRRHVPALCVAALALAQTATAHSGEPFQTVLHDRDVYGARDIADGNYERGIDRLSSRLGKGRQPLSVKVPILIDLCAAYTVTRQLDKAKDTCDKAVESGWYSGIAYNNRGAFNIAKGNYAAASEDFRQAIKGSGADNIATDNLVLVQARLKARSDLVKPQHAVASVTAGGAAKAE